MVTNQKVAVVTGSSSGTEFETPPTLARNGFHMYATMRNLEKSFHITEKARNENLLLQAIHIDVNNEKSLKGINRISEIIDFTHSGKASSDNDKEEDQKALFSEATGLTGKTAEHSCWLKISSEREVLR